LKILLFVILVCINGIKEAFIDQRIINFDMLAGKGKSEFYKSKYKGNVVDFITLRVTTSKILKFWYIIYHSAR